MTSPLTRFLTGAVVMLGLAPALAAAQQPTTIAGRVTTEAGSPLQGASVTIADVGIGTYSNAEGRYTFTVPGTRSTGQLARVTARRIGYRAQAVNDHAGLLATTDTDRDHGHSRHRPWRATGEESTRNSAAAAQHSGADKH